VNEPPLCGYAKKPFVWTLIDWTIPPYLYTIRKLILVSLSSTIINLF
jgi:hypothetical protein